MSFRFAVNSNGLRRLPAAEVVALARRLGLEGNAAPAAPVGPFTTFND